MVATSRLLLLAPLFAGLTAGCTSTSDVPLEPITPEDLIEIQERQNRAPNLGKIDDMGVLFITLDQNLRTWRELKTSDDAEDQLQLESVEEALTRLVYNNFDTILEALRSGDRQNRVTAAAALGFSRIPAPDEPGGDPAFPPVHQRAVQPLVDATGEGSDQLTQNALLSLHRIASPETPIDLLLEILVAHHDPAVRSNAVLALSSVLKREHRDLVTGPLYSALNDDSEKVRLHAVTAVGKLQDPSSLGKVLGVYTDDSSPLVRANAAFVIGHLGEGDVTCDAIPYLIRGLNDPKQVIRFYSHLALKTITGEDRGQDPEEWLRWYQSNQAASS